MSWEEAYRRWYKEWEDSLERIDIPANREHVEKYKDCHCYGGFWLPTKSGVSDIFALDDCSLCGAEYYYASDAGVKLHYEAYDDDSMPYDYIRQVVGLKGDNKYSWLIICPCCWKEVFDE